ncbi:MAG: anthranilate synthase component I [Pseudomonadota bacterium]
MYYPDLKTFKKLSKEGNVIPVYREILADMETPVTALMKLREKPHVFLLESVEGGEKWARYSFVGADPQAIFQVSGDEVLIRANGTVQRSRHDGRPLMFLKELLGRYRPVAVAGLPRFYGGAVGFLGYDMVRFFERLPAAGEDDLKTAEAVFMITDTMIIFDNVRHTLKIVASAMTQENADIEAVYRAAVEKIDRLITTLQAPFAPPHATAQGTGETEFQANMTPDAFRRMVRQAKDYIMAGDIIQVVLSQRFQRENGIDPVNLYRALRYVNPSPYLFFLKLDDLTLIGSSPEVMVRLEEGIVELKPIAGTKRRGGNEQEDRKLADELLNDPKERAEHVMLVDLGRNDLGRIARTGSVQVNRLMAVERYSHVMHLVSDIQAQLAPDRDAFDVLKATFPAGTLSGAPKVRAMEIIDEMEPSRRGPYGGAVGYFSFSGNMDFCITIRTMMVKDGRIYVQVGAGIVADSDPETEYHETISKAAGMMQAIRLAESGFDALVNSRKTVEMKNGGS